MNDLNRPWPPLIVAEHVPRLVKWRDVLLTLSMWGFFAVLLDAEFQLFLGDVREQLGFGAPDTHTDWPIFFERLMPFFLTAAVLAGLLVIFSLRTVQRRYRALLLPQPEPLAAAEQARHAGLDEAALTAARERRIVTVQLDAGGRPRIEAPNG